MSLARARARTHTKRARHKELDFTFSFENGDREVGGKALAHFSIAKRRDTPSERALAWRKTAARERTHVYYSHGSVCVCVCELKRTHRRTSTHAPRKSTYARCKSERVATNKYMYFIRAAWSASVLRLVSNVLEEHNHCPCLLLFSSNFFQFIDYNWFISRRNFLFTRQTICTQINEFPS